MNPEPAASLRQRAEGLLRVRRTDISKLTQDEIHSLVHDLEVHQIELELQNEELRQAQIELADARDRFSDLYDFAPVGYLTLSPEGDIRAANLTAATILGVDRKDMLDRKLAKFMPRVDADQFHLHLVGVFGDNKDICDLHIIRHDGERRTIRLESIKKTASANEPVHCRTTMSDITELVQAYEALERSDRLAALGTMAAGIAHEINNPLWMIALQAEVGLAANDKPDREQIVTKCLQEIKHLVERGGHIVNRILRFSTRTATEKHVQSIHDVLQRARDYTRVRARHNKVRLEFKVPDDLPHVRFNAIEIEQMLVNLLANAVDASQAGGCVRVTASANAHVLTVRVADQGSGMTAQQCRHIFDPFYTTRRRQGGIGLGLNLVQRIVEDHDGSIDVKSQPGKGTGITIRFPVPGNDNGGSADGNHLDC